MTTRNHKLETQRISEILTRRLLDDKEKQGLRILSRKHPDDIMQDHRFWVIINEINRELEQPLRNYSIDIIADIISLSPYISPTSDQHNLMRSVKIKESELKNGVSIARIEQLITSKTYQELLNEVRNIVILCKGVKVSLYNLYEDLKRFNYGFSKDHDVLRSSRFKWSQSYFQHFKTK